MKDFFYLTGIVLNLCVGAFCLSILAKTFNADPIATAKELYQRGQSEFNQLKQDVPTDDTIPYSK